jgi:hypothetical protein
MVHATLSRPARIVAPNRVYDHIYDPVYTINAAAGNQRTLQKSLVSWTIR